MGVETDIKLKLKRASANWSLVTNQSNESSKGHQLSGVGKESVKRELKRASAKRKLEGRGGELGRGGTININYTF